MFTVTYKGRNLKFEEKISLLDILINNNIVKDYNYIVCCALVDNQLRELTYVIDKDSSVEFLDLTDKDARSIYMRSLSFIFLKAMKEIDPDAKCTIGHSLSNGLYCDIENPSSPINKAYQSKVKDKMHEIISKNEQIIRNDITTKEAIEIYEKNGNHEKAKMLGYRDSENAVVYELDGMMEYFYGFMLPNTGFLKVFDLKLYNGALVLLGPDLKNPAVVSEFIHEPRLFTIYAKAKEWSKLLEIPSVPYLNENIRNGKFPELIRAAEAYQEKKICEISDMISSDADKRIILISGPSSSGKTSFAQRLKYQLMVNKKKPVSISVDNYFINRVNTPRDEFGRYDFESIAAIDLDRFNEDLENLLAGAEVTLPIYNFITGERQRDEISPKLQIESDQPIIIEGIHCLNPLMTESISYGYKFRIYVSALTPLNLDSHNRISTTDVRLIRRIIRDNFHRGNSASDTLAMWDSVNAGERKNIFVFQENADVMFNSALIYEIAVMKKYIQPLLEKIDTKDENYREARRMLKFLQYFESIEDESDIPFTSILREFIGGSKLV